MQGKGNCQHGEFDLMEGCAQCEELRRTGNTELESVPDKEVVDGLTEEEQTYEAARADQTEPTTALIEIGVDQDEKVMALYNKGVRLRDFAVARKIAINDDLKPAVDDLSIISGLKKSIEEERKEYVNPIRAHLDRVNQAFKSFTEPLVEADQVNRQKITEYRTEVARKIAEAEAIEKERVELARREEELTGEHTVDLSPVEAPAPAPARTHTDMGTVGTMKVPKWEVIDPSLVPEDYMMIDSAKVQAVVKASKGTITIPGIRIWIDEVVRVNTR